MVAPLWSGVEAWRLGLRKTERSPRSESLREMEPGAGTAGDGCSLSRDRLTDYAARRRPVNVSAPDAGDVIAYNVLAVNGDVESAGAGGVGCGGFFAGAEREDHKEQATGGNE
jgi:hypothetical protein